MYDLFTALEKNGSVCIPRLKYMNGNVYYIQVTGRTENQQGTSTLQVRPIEAHGAPIRIRFGPIQCVCHLTMF